MCGKFAMCNVLRQNGIRYTIIPPFTADPGEEVFREHLRSFAGICRIVAGMRRMNIGAVGARTTAFKTVRVDEIALQRHGINVETFDLAEIFRRMKDVPEGLLRQKKEQLLGITEFGFEESKLRDICRFGAVIDGLVAEYDLHGVAIRCWDELELAYGIAPCLVLCELNERGIPAACEVDISNAVMMRALSLAGDSPPMLLDINNNYGMEDNKCILFHCGPVPISLLEEKGQTIEHLMFAKSYGPGSGVGVNKGKIRKNLPVTFGSAKTENGRIYAFVGEGRFTGDPVEESFFGTGVVLENPRMQNILDYVGRNGYRHHMSITAGRTAWTVREGLENYLGYEIHRFGE
jgi:L-fucose isomerase-like protein